MIVACPKCATPNDVGAQVSTEGIKVNCSSCGVKFVVRRASTMQSTQGPRYYVRRRTGNSFGPFVEAVVASMLQQKKLDGSEEVSQDGKNWMPIGDVPAFQGLAPKPEAAVGRVEVKKTIAFGSPRPAPPADLPAPRETIPNLSDLPAPRETIPNLSNLPAPRETIPNLSNLPAPREDVPSPTDLPGPRGTILGAAGARPRPARQALADLPAPREDVPAVSDLPAPRETIPNVPDLPEPRGTIFGATGNLPAPREAIPNLQNLPAPKQDGEAGIDNLPAPKADAPDLPSLDFGDFAPGGADAPDAGATIGETDLLAPRDGLPRDGFTPVAGMGNTDGLDLPAPKGAPQALDFGGFVPSFEEGGTVADGTVADGTVADGTVADGGAAPFSMAGGSMNLDGPPDREPPSMQPLDFGQGPPAAGPGPMGGSRSTGGLRADPGGGLDLGLAFDEATTAGSLSLDLPASIADTTPTPPQDIGLAFDSTAMGGGMSEGEPDRTSSNLDLGLAFDDDGSGSAGPSRGDRTVEAPPEGLGSFGELSMESESAPARPLQPIAQKAKAAPPPIPGKRRRRREGQVGKIVKAVGAVAAVGVVAGASVALDLPDKILSGRKPAEVIAPVAASLARDEFASYGQAIALLEAVARDQGRNTSVRAVAAELALTSAIARGADRKEIERADFLLRQVPSEKTAPAVRRARALLAISRQQWSAADTLLGAAGPPDAAAGFVSGWRYIGDNKARLAVGPLQRAVAVDPRGVVRFTLGRAQEAAGDPGAEATYKLVLKANPRHMGAELGLLRLSKPKDDEVSSRIDDLVKTATDAGPGEMAEAYVMAARASHAAGKESESDAYFDKAIAADLTNLPANLARGESLLAQGRYDEALQRYQALTIGGAEALEARFGLAGALIGTGSLPKGLEALKKAQAAAPKDPRGPYWVGRAADLGDPPDQVAAQLRYQEALELAPKFLPASLQLAAVLVRQGKATEALAALKAAEDAGSPKDRLQVAWGQALLASRDPARAKQAYQNALAQSPKLEPARLGLAAAYEAGGELVEAKTELDRLLADAPKTPGLRERIASVLIKLGKREDALAVYEEEIAKGAPTLSLRTGACHLAVDLGRLDLAKTLADKLVKDDARFEGTLFCLARTQAAQDNTTGAMQEFRRAVQADPRPVVHYEYGLLLAKVRKDPQALEQFAAAKPMPEGKLESGRVLIGQGDYAHARSELEDATKAAPQMTDAWVLLGIALHRSGEKDAAEAAWKTAIRLDPDSVIARYQLGKAESEKGHPAAAMAHFNRIAGKVTAKSGFEEKDYYFEVGFNNEQLGHKAASCAGYKKFLEVAPPTDKSRKEAIEKLKFKLGCMPVQ